jgi:hypothetical protein
MDWRFTSLWFKRSPPNDQVLPLGPITRLQSLGVTTVRSKPQQNQLLSDGWWFSLVVIGLQGA